MAAFTFYCSSIKETIDKMTTNTKAYLHSTVVLLKQFKRAMALEEKIFTFYCSSIKALC